jgi:hypothetical protein
MTVARKRVVRGRLITLRLEGSLGERVRGMPEAGDDPHPVLRVLTRPRTKGFVERFNRTLPDEYLRVAF